MVQSAFHRLSTNGLTFQKTPKLISSLKIVSFRLNNVKIYFMKSNLILFNLIVVHQSIFYMKFYEVFQAAFKVPAWAAN